MTSLSFTRRVLKKRNISIESSFVPLKWVWLGRKKSTRRGEQQAGMCQEEGIIEKFLNIGKWNALGLLSLLLLPREMRRKSNVEEMEVKRGLQDLTRVSNLLFFSFSPTRRKNKVKQKNTAKTITMKNAHSS